jgi:hypothetical protein
MVMALKMTVATIGFASRRSVAQPRAPGESTSRASHGGVASQNMGGMTSVRRKCWNMCSA